MLTNKFASSLSQKILIREALTVQARDAQQQPRSLIIRLTIQPEATQPSQLKIKTLSL